jgi:DNA helicase-4
MIEWLVGAAVVVMAGQLFSAGPSPNGPGKPRRESLSSVPRRPEDEKPASEWDAARFRELVAALDWLENPPQFPSANATPPILSEAAKHRGYLKRKLMWIGAEIGDKSLIGRINAFLKDPTKARESAIAAHTRRELARYEHFLDQVESKPLTDEQRRAVLSDEDATLVLAGAGSGKTSVITAKAAYLLKSGSRGAEEILPLAFGKEAANEMASRMSLACNAPIKAWTFHALAYHIIGDVEGTKPALAAHAGDPKRYSDVIRRILRQLVTSDEKVASAIIDWFSEFFVKASSEWDYKTKHDWYTHVESQNLRTLQGEKVRSYEELLIANWLYRNGVEYEYEPIYEHRLPASGKREYTPDFRLVESGIYLEHFGVRKEKSSPNSPERLVTAPFVNREGILGIDGLNAEYIPVSGLN